MVDPLKVFWVLTNSTYLDRQMHGGTFLLYIPARGYLKSCIDVTSRRRWRRVGGSSWVTCSKTGELSFRLCPTNLVAAVRSDL
uniref:Uncharacterized protein n=1 Tax=Timema monikensis TaxID=170555 RepID=A0A7R9HKL8_9NEOP|nr:unnamed protein product [Timema monikensis]